MRRAMATLLGFQNAFISPEADYSEIQVTGPEYQDAVSPVTSYARTAGYCSSWSRPRGARSPRTKLAGAPSWTAPWRASPAHRSGGARAGGSGPDHRVSGDRGHTRVPRPLAGPLASNQDSLIQSSSSGVRAAT